MWFNAGSTRHYLTRQVDLALGEHPAANLPHVEHGLAAKIFRQELGILNQNSGNRHNATMLEIIL
jgi:hypothetical protein